MEVRLKITWMKKGGSILFEPHKPQPKIYKIRKKHKQNVFFFFLILRYFHVYVILFMFFSTIFLPLVKI